MSTVSSLNQVLTQLRNLPAAPEPGRATSEDVQRPFRVLTVTSNKGGVGKTTLATNLAVYFRALREDLPILLLGFDDQSLVCNCPLPKSFVSASISSCAVSILSGSAACA